MPDNKYNIRSLIKAMHILELLIENDKLSIAELSKLSKQGKSTVHRILGTFKELGYVEQNEEDGKYYATIRIFELGNRVANRIPIKKVARPYLEELYEYCHETVNLAILDGTDVVYLDKLLTKEPLRIDLEIGRRVPLYCSALGKVILAFKKETNIDDIEFEKFTNKTIDSSKKLKKELEEIRKSGYALDDEEYIKGLICVAVPIINNFGQAVAGISIAVPAVRMGKETRNNYIEELRKTRDKISNVMGY